MEEHLTSNREEAINQAQNLQFQLMELGLFNGRQVVFDLKNNRDVWIACVWGRFKYNWLIPLRDLARGYWNTDTLYILTTADKIERLSAFASYWKADEWGVVYADREVGDVDFKHDEVDRLGMSLTGDDCIVRVWWD